MQTGSQVDANNHNADISFQKLCNVCTVSRFIQWPGEGCCGILTGKLSVRCHSGLHWMRNIHLGAGNFNGYTRRRNHAGITGWIAAGDTPQNMERFPIVKMFPFLTDAWQRPESAAGGQTYQAICY
jgi:hypothetical protein